MERIALVTGSTAGIGLAVAQDFAKSGMKTVLNGRRASKLAEVTKNLGADSCISVEGDCADSGVIERFFTESLAKFGAEPDLIVVNAGRGLVGSIMTADLTQLDELLRTNIIGAMKLIRRSGESMQKRSAGDAIFSRPLDIVILGSTVGRHISPFSSVYGSTKFAINALAEGARRELGAKGIRVSLIEPGIVLTEFQESAGYDTALVDNFHQKFGPLLRPDDIARTVSFIVSQPAHVHLNDVVIRPTRQDYP